MTLDHGRWRKRKRPIRNGLVFEFRGREFMNLPATDVVMDYSGNGNNGTAAGFGYIQPYAQITSDFVGKVSGSIVENPNIAKNNYGGTQTTLLAPTAISNEFVGAYTNISALEGTVVGIPSANSAGAIPQTLFSFNLIEIFERQYGEIPSSDKTTAGKVAWLKANIKIGSGGTFARWHGYGSCPSGNMARFKAFYPPDNTYYGSATNTTNSIGICDLVVDSINYIDVSGFIHFLAYTDAASTTGTTGIYLAAHGLVNGDIIENTSRGNAWGVVGYLSENFVAHAQVISGQTAGDSIKKYHTMGGTKVAEAGTTNTNLTITNHGMTTGDYIYNVQRANVSKVTVVDANNLTLTTPFTGQTTGDTIYRYSYTATQTAEATVAPSTIYTDYIKLDLTFKAASGSDNAGGCVFDGVDDYITTPHLGITGSEPFTIMLKGQFLTNAAGDDLIAAYSDLTSMGSKTFGLYARSTGAKFRVSTYTVNDYDTGFNKDFNEHVWALVYDGTGTLVYQDGAADSVGKKSATVPTFNSNSVLTLGRLASSSQANCEIKKALVYKGALTPQEIRKNTDIMMRT